MKMSRLKGTGEKPVPLLLKNNSGVNMLKKAVPTTTLS